MKRSKRTYSVELKRQAVDDYVSGRKSATEVATEHGVTPSHIYKWKIQLDEKAKGARIDELEASGMSTSAARKILEQEAVIAAYEKKVAEQAIIIDLLKKLQTSTDYLPVNELNGLIETSRRLAKLKKAVK